MLNMYWYGRGLEAVKTGAVDWGTDTIKVALLEAAYTPAQGTHQFFADVSASEASGAGYTAGGATLANRAQSYDAANLRVVLDADDVSWDPSSITAQYVVVYKDTGSPATSPLIGYGDAGAPQTSDGAAFSIEWNTDGIFRTTATAQV